MVKYFDLGSMADELLEQRYPFEIIIINGQLGVYETKINILYKKH